MVDLFEMEGRYGREKEYFVHTDEMIGEGLETLWELKIFHDPDRDFTGDLIDVIELEEVTYRDIENFIYGYVAGHKRGIEK